MPSASIACSPTVIPGQRTEQPCVGDSGQHDAAIYAEVVRRHPGRVLAVYIRDVTESEEADREAGTLLEEVRRAGTRATFCPDLLEAAADAAGQGWISSAAVEEVRREVAAAAVDGPST